MHEIIVKYWPSIIILLAGIAASVATFYSTKQDSKQKDRIEDYGKLNTKLSQNIESLSINNQKISSSVLDLSKLNNELTDELNKIALENLRITEENNKLSQHTKILSEKILDLSSFVRDLNTGGSSYLDLRHASLMVFQDNVQIDGDKLHLYFTLSNVGEFALDNVKIKGYSSLDFSKIDPVFLWTQLSLSGLNIHSRFASMKSISDSSLQQSNESIINSYFDVFKPGQSEQFGPIKFKIPFEYFGINLFIETKRQDWIILIRFYKPISSSQPFTFQASRILKMTGTGLQDIKTEIDQGFPLNAKGKIDWFSSELPDQWFTPKTNNY